MATKKTVEINPYHPIVKKLKEKCLSDPVLPTPQTLSHKLYRGSSLIRPPSPLGPYSRNTARVLRGSSGGGRFLMGEVPLLNLKPNLTPKTRKQEDGSTVQLAHILYDSALISAGCDLQPQT
jgi:hypothetical protein